MAPPREREGELTAEAHERKAYRERPPRFEYRLTEKGRELAVPLLALMQWGDRHLSQKPPRIARRRSDRSRVRAVLATRNDEVVSPADIEVVAGPGLARPSGPTRPTKGSASRDDGSRQE
jgi:hypothetical protein